LDDNIFEHNYNKTGSWYCNDYAQEIIKYTAGFIVKTLKKIVHCTSCINLLTQNSNYESTLITMKNRGGLNFASDEVFFICKCTEKVVRQNGNLFLKNIYSKLVNETLRMLPKTIFDNAHFFEQEPLLSHRNQLLVLIISKYIDIRLNHEGKIMNDHKERIRMQNNKLTIFCGQ